MSYITNLCFKTTFRNVSKSITETFYLHISKISSNFAAANDKCQMTNDKSTIKP